MFGAPGDLHADPTAPFTLARPRQAVAACARCSTLIEALRSRSDPTSGERGRPVLFVVAASGGRCSADGRLFRRNCAIDQRIRAVIAHRSRPAVNMRDVMCAPRSERRPDSWCELESRHVCKQSVCGNQGRSGVDGAGGDPQVVGVHRIGQGVPDTSARESHFGKCCQEAVADRDHRRAFDGLFESNTAGLTPFSEQCAVAQLCDCRCCKEDLISCEKGDLPIEVGASPAT